ncbi:membrane protein, partial [Acinetobacter baumannii]
PIIICDKLKWQYKWVRITFDVILVVLGFTLGGKLGLGTIIATLLIGPCIQFFLTPIETKITQLSRA